MTNISLPNSQIHVGIDFSHNEKINAIINNPDNTCYVLYPSDTSIKLNDTNIKKENKNLVIFIIDSTWPCSIKILRQSSNIQNLPYISFEHTKISLYKFKTQPKDLSLSTIESTLCVLELLNKHQIENIKENDLSNFLEPFTQMIKFQMSLYSNPNKKQVRYKQPKKNNTK